ncbi:MAG: efflux RND transporter periplasmic adaptor subunit [Spirochaetes bacterium]|nr:efflux RND transporter periplasmic adaptor subunit [Spirochaetota bacterium]
MLSKYFAALAMILILLSNCKKAEELKENTVEAKTVRVMNVEKISIPEKINIFGKIYPQQTVQVFPKINGEVESIIVQTGDKVYKNRKMATIKQNLPGSNYTPHEVKAVIEGTVLAVLTEVGQTVNQNTPIFEIGDLKCLLFKGQVFGDDRKKVKKGQTLVVEDESSSDKLGMVVTRISPKVDDVTGGLTIEAQICLITQDILFPGQSIDGYIVSGNTQGITIPRRSLLEQNGQSGVYLVKENIATYSSVNIISSTIDYWIVNGLQPGDAVITDGVYSIQDGEKVVILGE